MPDNGNNWQDINPPLPTGVQPTDSTGFSDPVTIPNPPVSVSNPTVGTTSTGTTTPSTYTVSDWLATSPEVLSGVNQSGTNWSRSNKVLENLQSALEGGKTYEEWLAEPKGGNGSIYDSPWQDRAKAYADWYSGGQTQTPEYLNYNDWLAEQQAWLSDPEQSQTRYDEYAQSQREQGLVPDSFDNWLTTQQDIYGNEESASQAYATYRGNSTNGGAGVDQIVPGEAEGNNQINVADYTGQLAVDPSLALTPEQVLANSTPTIGQDQIDQGSVGNQDAMNPNEFNAQTNTVGDVAQANSVVGQDAQGYTAQQTQDDVANSDMTAAQGTVSNQTQIEAPQIDVDATAAGDNAVGEALMDFASLDPNDVDTRATVLGQIDLLQAQFVDENGNAKIPAWASGIARNVSKIAAFKGLTGTAATQAMSQALLESSISIAKQDAQFFQTLTLQNLSNEQQSIIQKANVLANMDMANLDAKTVAAVQNSKNFMQMDLANLDNEQQARLINTQARVQSILEDAKAENAARLFTAESQNQMDMFYDNLNAQIEQYNASQYNSMNQFNAGEANAMERFNSEMSDSRDKFYREMAYNIDIANAKWRQEVTLTNTQMDFEAAAFDAKNLINISQEALNKLWDRSDALLDYIWKSSENELDRNSALAVAKLQADSSLSIAKAREDAGTKAGIGQVIGSVAGALIGKLF